MRHIPDGPDGPEDPDNPEDLDGPDGPLAEQKNVSKGKEKKKTRASEVKAGKSPSKG